MKIKKIGENIKPPISRKPPDGAGSGNLKQCLPDSPRREPAEDGFERKKQKNKIKQRTDQNSQRQRHNSYVGDVA